MSDVPVIEPIYIRKLRSSLNETLMDEYRVLYVMAQSRKVLELEKPYRPGCMYLYCCWPLHVELSKKGTRDLMDVFDTPETVGDFQQQREPDSRLNELISFSAFRRDFKVFLLDYSLPTDVVDDDERWHDFLFLYSDLVVESPLCYSPTPPFKHIKNIEVQTFAADRLQDDRPPAAILWRITPLVGKPYCRAYGYPDLSEENERHFWIGE